MEIEFRRISQRDIQKIYEWRNKPHMNFWGKEGITLEAVQKKYGWRISWQDSCQCYITSYDGKDFWLIQYYKNIDEPEYSQEIGVEDGASIDLFIGDESFLRKGFGKQMLEEFVEKIFKQVMDIEVVYICHEKENIAAIACSESVGFEFVKQVVEDNKPSKLYKIMRNNV